jgi:hypothetical protein
VGLCNVKGSPVADKNIKLTIVASYSPRMQDYLDEHGVQRDPLEEDRNNLSGVGPMEALTWCDPDTIEATLEYVDDKTA